MNQNLTTGKPETVLWHFCLPLFGSIIFQQLYNIADSLVAGKFIGENALAAVGNSYEITLIFIAFAFGLNIGCSVVVSLFFGAGNYKDMKTAVTTAMIISGAVCLALGTGMTFLRIVAPFYFVVSAKLVADGILRGASLMGRFMASTFTDLILRVVLAIVLSRTALGATGIWCAWPVGWTIATCLSVFFSTRTLRPSV